MATGSLAATRAPAASKFLDEHQCRGLAHIVGAGLEGESPHCDLATVHIAVKMLEQALSQVVFLPLVDRFPPRSGLAGSCPLPWPC